MRVSPGVTRYRAKGPVWRELAREAGLASAEPERGPGGTVVTHVCGEGREILCVFEVHLFVLVAGEKRKVVTHLWGCLRRCVTSAGGGFGRRRGEVRRWRFGSSGRGTRGGRPSGWFSEMADLPPAERRPGGL